VNTIAVILSVAKDLSGWIAVLCWALVIPDSAAAQMYGQSFEVSPQVSQATVGDSVTLVFRVRLDERDLLFDTVPQPLSAIPPGVRLLSVEKLQRSPDRLFHGRAQVAFYRPGRRAVPLFGLPFMRAVKGVGRGTLPSDSAYVEIVPLLPAGNPPLKDIRELEPGPRPSLLPLIVGTLVAAALLVRYFRRRRRRPLLVTDSVMAQAVPAEVPSAYTLALEQLARIERDQWPARAEIARHYEMAVDTLRGYLEAAEDLPARERTTGEVLWSLPPHLTSDGLRDHAGELFDEADLVKFARFVPSPDAAAEFLERCRSLLGEWHAARSIEEVVDAVR
jgi:hypothetical protein